MIHRKLSKIKMNILHEIISNFISIIILENSYIKSLNTFFNDHFSNLNINNVNNVYYTNKEKYIDSIIEQFRKICYKTYHNFIFNDISVQLLEKFKSFINNIRLLYLSYGCESSNYSSIYKNVRIVRAPPIYSKN